MIYQEHQPHCQLLPFIETYWTSSGFAEGQEVFRILPDGCVDILFSFVESPVENGLTPFIPYIIGTMTSYSNVYYNGHVSMLGIRFRPAGITAFTRVSIDSFTNQRVDINLVETLFDAAFYDFLSEKKSTIERIRHINTYFLQKLPFAFQPEQQIVCAVDLIRATKGQLSLAEIAKKVCLSPRHFERKFKSAIGVTPKMFSKIVKFESALAFLKEHKNESVFSVAIHCCYYDHAHITKDFQVLSGSTPSSFRK